MNIFFLVINEDVLPPTKHWSYGAKEWVALIATIMMVVAALFFWVLVIRKNPRRRRKYHRRPGTFGKNVEGVKGIIRQRRRHHRRERRALNPTLAETGGLPPPRGEGSGGQPQSPPPS